MDQKPTKGYNGNINLKPAGTQINYEHWQIEERIKCANDPIYFIENYIKIVHVDHGLVPFVLYPYQKKLVKAYHENRFNIIKAPRQSGKTTATVGYVVWYVIFQNNKTAALLANKALISKEIMDRFQTAYEHLPWWMQQGVVEWNTFSISLENESKVMAAATSSSGIRGKSINLIILDEFAHIDKNIAEEFMTSVYPTISSGKTTKMIISSTPNGMNLFHKYWQDAVNKKNLYVPTEVHLHDVPGRDKKWEAAERLQLGNDKFEQEYLCSFLGSANTLISKDTLATLSWQDPKITKPNLKVYQEPEDKRVYTIICDPSEGTGNDNTAAVVIDSTDAPYKVVATFKSNVISPMVLPTILIQMAKYYKNAHIFVESNSVGFQVAQILAKENEYEYIISGVGGDCNKLCYPFSKNALPGVKTTKRIKNTGCINLKMYMENSKLITTDHDIVEEFSHFGHRGVGLGYCAEEGYTDDLVMCLVLFSWLSDQMFFKDYNNLILREQIIKEKMTELEDEVPPLGGISEATSAVEEKPKYVDPSGFVWDTSYDDPDALF